MSAPAVAEEKARPAKKPVNRKLAVIAFLGVGVLGMLALLAVGNNDPRKRVEEKAEAARLEALLAQKTGSEERAKKELADMAAELEREKKKRASAQGQTPQDQPAPALPALSSDAALAARLDALDAAQQEVMKRRDVATAITSPPPTDRSRPQAFQPANVGVGGAGSTNGVYENYPTAAGATANTNILDDPNQAKAAALGADGFFETTKPQAPPSSRVLSQGTVIAAVLVSRIDTRQPGPIIAMINRDVYDSVTSQTKLLAKGARLIGQYDADARPGTDRVSATFERLVLTDGRAMVLPGLVGAGMDGTNGIDGKFRSNFLRAIGPSFIVALLGQTLDNQISPPDSGGGFGTNPPSVAQQIVPKVNDMILDRYAGAKPYFTVKAGEPIRLILTADLEIPEPTPAAAGGR